MYILKIYIIHIINEEYKLKLAGDFYLPIAINVTKLRIYKAVLNTYTDEEAFYKADKRLSVYLDDLRKKEVEILENNVKIEINHQDCVSRGTLTVIERTGREAPTEKKTQPKERTPEDG